MEMERWIKMGFIGSDGIKINNLEQSMKISKTKNIKQQILPLRQKDHFLDFVIKP